MPEYTPITQSDDYSSSAQSVYSRKHADDRKDACEHCARIAKGRWLSCILLGVSIVLLTANIFLSVMPSMNTWRPSEEPVIKSASGYEHLLHTTEKNCVQRLSSYTPAIDAIDYFEANLYDAYSDADKYIGPPTAEREQSWRELWQHEATMVENWAMPILNRTDPEPYEIIESDGKEGFTAMSKVYHQLGCLDIIRQYTWLLEGRYPQDLISLEMQKPAEETRKHIDRCIEDLRISLMCYSDMTPLLITKERDPDSGFKAELNSHHKCRNFHKLVDWTISHGVEHWEKEGGFHQHGDRV